MNLNNNSNQPLPSYSLADLFRDINQGLKHEFEYNGRKFHVCRAGIHFKITDQKTGFTAINKAYTNSMLDLQGCAACLIEYKKNIIFDKNGNLI